MLNTLTLEITRRCNMQCKHCIRGPEEPCDLLRDTATMLCEQLNREGTTIGKIYFTGGEPTLNIDGMKMLRDIMSHHGVRIENFYVAINGKEVPDEFIEEMNEWEKYCTNNNISTISISTDQYHPKASGDISKLVGNRFVKYRKAPYKPYYEGNAINNFEFRDCRLLPYVDRIRYYDSGYINHPLAMNIYGDVYTYDISYARQRRDKANNNGYYVGNIFCTTLTEMVKQYNNRYAETLKWGRCYY